MIQGFEEENTSIGEIFSLETLSQPGRHMNAGLRIQVVIYNHGRGNQSFWRGREEELET